MKTYLSFDLDYYNYTSTTLKMLAKIEKTLNDITAFSQEYRVPVLAVMNHQQLLTDVNNSQCDTLINVDTHSDLVAYEDSFELNCGTWVSYVKWRKNGSYFWIHADETSYGDCSGDAQIFVAGRRYNTDWRRCFHKRSKLFPELGPDIKSIGVCLSPDYVDSYGKVLNIFKKWVKLNNIPYLKGRTDESFGRKIYPSCRG